MTREYVIIIAVSDSPTKVTNHESENAHEGDPVNTGGIMNLIVAQYK